MAHSINMDDSALKAGETARVTVFLDDTYSPVLQGTGVNVRLQYLDFSQAPGTVEYVTSETVAGGTNYIFTFTPTSNTQNAGGTIRMNVPAAGDRPAINLSKTYTADTQRPTLASNYRFSPDCDLTAGDTATITFNFSEPVTGFTVDDLTIPPGKGTLSNLRTTDGGTTWTVDLRAPATLPANTPEDVQITVNMAGITDAAGNAGTGSATLATYSLGNKPPSIVSVVGPTSIVTGDTQVVITFTFDEAITGFALANINLDNSSASPYFTYSPKEPVTADGGRTWTITYRASPHVASDLTNTVSIRNLDGVRDLAGNAAVPNSSASTGNYEVDAVDPRPTSAVFDKTRLTAGETATVTITFNESVSNVTKTTLEIPNGTVSDPTPVAGSDGRVWTATFTPTANLARTSSSIRISLDGLRDRAGNVASGAMPFYDSTIVIDTKVFVVNDATVNDKQLVLRYSDETMLDPDQAHNAPGDAFVVLVNGVRNDVTGVTVDAAAKTVTLTLERAVRKGQQVSVAYDDPSTGDDQQAVQDATTGKDAASFAAKPVTNLSPAAPAPDAPDAGAPDSDRDGLSNNREDLAHGLLRPDGSAGLEGDGNGDGVKDSQQVAVASNRDLTLVAGSQDGKLIPDSNARISELVRSEAPANLPKGMEMPIGLTSFKVALAEGRSTESFSLYVDPALGATGYWVKNSAGTWVNLASEPYGGKVTSEGGRTRLDFQIEDGGQYDADGQADGSISTPGAVAKMPLSIVGQAPQVESHGFWF
ncbi:Ig-like domain-containing protein [Verminephrobacter eiseniae]|uniref:Ig-like domain-containing protein n=1 Tax=Verminephrobacter eiseniae TaxID=364317 RepID=UPI002237FB20|nr:Ig-like domain-containing protein [Verminephrobacter eiseniae]MCW5238539.1 hypothetical protein [Verminephrobacter eiseniae]